MIFDEVTNGSELDMFLWPVSSSNCVDFEKRDVILIIGLLLFMVGLMPFMAPVYAVLIVIIMYFGIKFYVSQRKKMIKQDIGVGICAECGSPIHDEACPHCDSDDK